MGQIPIFRWPTHQLTLLSLLWISKRRECRITTLETKDDVIIITRSFFNLNFAKPHLTAKHILERISNRRWIFCLRPKPQRLKQLVLCYGSRQQTENRTLRY